MLITRDNSLWFEFSMTSMKCLFEQVVVNALIKAIPSIANVMMVCLIFWLIFGIVGVQFFAGKFFKCVDADGNKLSPNITANRTECEAKGYEWINSKVNFDNVLMAYLALFQVVSVVFVLLYHTKLFQFSIVLPFNFLFAFWFAFQQVNNDFFFK